jgi:hypothetical protein
MKYFIAILTILLAISFKANASPVIIDQLSGFSTNAASESILGRGEVSSHFTINEGVHIDAASWVGVVGYRTSTDIAKIPDFIIRIYSDASNGPNQLIFEEKLTPVYSASEYPINSAAAGVFSSNTSIDLQAGQYWISFLGITSESVSSYGAALEPGSLSTIFGSGGAIKLTPSSPWQPTNYGVSFYQGRGYTFSLQGYASAIPEPSSYIASIFGLSIIILFRQSIFQQQRKNTTAKFS